MERPAGLLMALYVVFLARREDLLELEARRRLYEVVERFPGLHLREIARNASMDANHAKYHLLYMEKNGLVSSREEGGYWRFFPKVEGRLGPQEVLSPNDKAVLALLRQPVPLHCILVLLNDGESSIDALAQRVGVAHSTLLYHLGKLERSGLLESRKDGRMRLVRLSSPEAIQSQLLRFRPPDSLVSGFLEAWEQLELP